MLFVRRGGALACRSSGASRLRRPRSRRGRAVLRAPLPLERPGARVAPRARAPRRRSTTAPRWALRARPRASRRARRASGRARGRASRAGLPPAPRVVPACGRVEGAAMNRIKWNEWPAVIDWDLWDVDEDTGDLIPIPWSRVKRTPPRCRAWSPQCVDTYCRCRAEVERGSFPLVPRETADAFRWAYEVLVTLPEPLHVYQVSNLGYLRRWQGDQWHVVRAQDLKGYPYVALRADRPFRLFGQRSWRDQRLYRITVALHRVVAQTFHGDRPSRWHEVDHIDRNTNNARASNLRWVTHEENMRNR